ncbi:acyl-CoA N-acyltransferase [Auriculariales sp. MPI-PUGE-AT-0066]|nr:acyl-CoA N-acyltransferase [Auriculariales sp. MPI-PUGE-AT-0066]
MPLPPPEYTVERLSTEDALQESIKLRFRVFTDEQGFPAETEVDEHDNLIGTTHIAIRLTQDGTMVGTIRIRHTPGQYYKLERLCIREDSRKYGFGSILVAAAHQWAKEDLVMSHPGEQLIIVCYSQLHAIKFYQKFGYIPEGEPFDEDGAPHQKLLLQLSGV